VVIERTPLEDELGDVLEKALRHAGLTESALSEKTGIEEARLRDAIDYRYDLGPDDLRRLAAALGLNEVGLLALAGGRYALPEIKGLPFCVYPLRMTHGIGVANAYIVADCCRETGILFDTGTGGEALRRVWPANIRRLEAVFVTHRETEHVGGLPEVVRLFDRVPVFGPAGMKAEGVTAVGEGATFAYDAFEIEVLSTPGHVEAHHCYVVRSKAAPGGTPLLVSGDLLFAGSVGGGYFCHRRLLAQVRRLLDRLPESTVLAPGHGPMTTLAHERRFNPFLV
jgi:glyoxylase-like metal-dependent hydrolase (beta-lactamase superfamily II)